MYLKIKDHASIRREGSGLAAYVHTRLAAIISDKTVKNAIKNGTSEHYDSVTGKPLGIPDYCMSSSIATIMSTPLFASTAIFPSSSLTPAADISATQKVDKNGNYRISITAKNLASPDRLNPPQSVYVAWIVTHTEGTKNIGRLTNKNAQTAKLETVTPFAFSEIIITAEGQDDISYPYGIEIARARFSK